MIKTINNPIILVDGSFYIHRAYHAIPSLTTSRGQPVWVIYGVINMIKNLLTRYQPTHMAIVFDSPGRTFRDDIFEKYKSHRVKIPKDLCDQIDPLYDIIRAIGVPILNIPYVEADDVIATLATSCAQSDSDKMILISTGDKDMAQIVSSKIILINTISNIILDAKGIEKKYGVPPSLIADYLALIGDRSDNIPGVPGIGKKIAPILLTQIGNLKILYQNLYSVSTIGLRGFKRIQNLLITHKTIAWLSYRLASIKVNVPLKKSDYVLSIQNINIQNLEILFKKYEFYNWLTELRLGKWLRGKYTHVNHISLNGCMTHTDISQKKDLVWDASVKSRKSTNFIINNIQSLWNWIRKIQVTDFLIFNIYTDIPDIFKSKIISLCISIYDLVYQENVYIPIIRSNESNNHDEHCLYLKEVLNTLKPMLENSKIKKIGQNMKFNHAVLKRYNVNLVGITFDVLLEFYILYGTISYHNIKRFLDSETFNSIVNFKKAYDDYNNSYICSINRNIQLELSCTTKLMHTIFDLHQVLWPKIKINNKLKKIFEDIEMPLISVLSRIERYGVLIDKDLLYSHTIELNSRLHELKKEVYQLVDIPFNLDSTKQLQEILYNKQKLPILKKTPHGAPSTSEEVLKKLAKKYSIPKIVLQYRGLSKLKTTYTDKLVSMINKKSNRIHTSYNQIRTSTGRLSSANPNLQNIPNRNYDGRKIRQAFIAPENFLIVSADYSQIELRIMAHLSHDFKLINDFLSGKDIHTATASEIFVTALHLVTNEQRHRAKTINFGLIYGMSAFGLARQLSITCKEAQRYVDRYFQRYPGVMEYIKYIKNDASKHGYVSTLDGRKLYLPEIYSDNISQKKSAERAAINAPMQGSAADIIKRAMISIDFWLQKDNIPARMIMQVHDELVFEVQNNFIDIAVKQIKKLMEECFILDVPLKVDIGIGKNWEQAH